ncbi:MAG: hypothetical protein ACYDBJ_01705 [Aggregatilineales bacterium]
MTTNIGFEIKVVRANIMTFEADVLTLVYPQSWTSLGRQVVEALSDESSIVRRPPRSGEWRLVPSEGVVKAPALLLLGAPPRRDFTYDALRHLSRQAINALYEAGNNPPSAHVAMTVFGIGWGFDEAEAFRAMLFGFISAVEDDILPSQLKRISVVENRSSRAEVLNKVLEQFWQGDTLPAKKAAHPKKGAAAKLTSPATPSPHEAVLLTRDSPEPAAPIASLDEPSIFVAMPFSPRFNDLYYFAILPAVKAVGYQCIRLDQVSYTGDVIETIKARIRDAELVVGVLDSLNPNVFLEVGYAWGQNVPTLLLVSAEQVQEKLPFDVISQRYISYDSIRQLAEHLPGEIRAVLKPRNSRPDPD